MRQTALPRELRRRAPRRRRGPGRRRAGRWHRLRASTAASSPACSGGGMSARTVSPTRRPLAPPRLTSTTDSRGRKPSRCGRPAAISPTSRTRTPMGSGHPERGSASGGCGRSRASMPETLSARTRPAGRRRSDLWTTAPLWTTAGAGGSSELVLDRAAPGQPRADVLGDDRLVHRVLRVPAEGLDVREVGDQHGVRRCRRRARRRRRRSGRSSRRRPRAAGAAPRASSSAAPRRRPSDQVKTTT